MRIVGSEIIGVRPGLDHFILLESMNRLHGPIWLTKENITVEPRGIFPVGIWKSCHSYTEKIFFVPKNGLGPHRDVIYMWIISEFKRTLSKLAFNSSQAHTAIDHVLLEFFIQPNP